MTLLAVQNLEKKFGGLIAVNDISFEVERGEIFTIIGPNGAGKSTLFKLITAVMYYQKTTYCAINKINGRAEGEIE